MLYGLVDMFGYGVVVWFSLFIYICLSECLSTCDWLFVCLPVSIFGSISLRMPLTMYLLLYMHVLGCVYLSSSSICFHL